MRIRHKVPSIFSLSMVDVLCCALGCVILIWLLNAKQSEDESDDRQQEIATLRTSAEADRAAGAKLLAGARDEYNKASTRLAQLLDERKKAALAASALESRIRDLEKRKWALEKDLALSRSDAAALAGKMKRSAARVSALETDLRTALDRVAMLDKTLDKSAERLKKEEASLRLTRADLAALRKQAEAARERADEGVKSLAQRERELAVTSKSLAASSRTRARLETSLAAKDKQIKDLEAYRERYAAAIKREQTLDEKLRVRLEELDEAGRKIALLERGGKDYATRLNKSEKDRLAALALAGARVARLEKEKESLRTAAENRFAGITLTGKRVIFLVDTSGSMMMLNAQTDAPQKWKEVYTTVGKLLRSMPDVEKYQLITFAKTTAFPLGSEGKWLTHDPATTPDRVQKTLAAIKPSGGTNMYSALEAAFDYRQTGLDTIYLLSDGLPNQGEGVTPAERLRLSESERSQKLGRVVLAKLKNDWNKAQAGSPKVRINTIGFFFESPDLGAFLWALARANDGSFVGMSSP